MMAIRRRGSSWQVDIQVKGQRWRGAAATKPEAEALEASVKAAMLAGASMPSTSSGAPRTLGWLVEHVYEHHWRGMKAGEQAHHNARCAVLFFGKDADISGIGTADIDKFVFHLTEKGNADATINRKLAALSKCLHWAGQRRWLDQVPYIPRRTERNGRTRYLSAAEEAAAIAVLRELGHTETADLVIVLIDTGLRVSEALGLRWADTILIGDRARLTVWETKNGGARTVPLTRRAAAILKKRSQAGNEKPFDEMGRWEVRANWDAMRRRLGLMEDSQFVPHALRHTCASRLVQRGVPIPVVKEWLGHKTISVTMRYAHLSPDQLFNAVKVLDGDGAGAARL